MRKKRVIKQATAIAICSAMAATNVFPAFAADLAHKYTYQGANGTMQDVLIQMACFWLHPKIRRRDRILSM